MQALGALDFAGGTVVHISSGVSALVCAIVVGKRHGFPTEYMAPHNLPLVVTGAALLWVGWFRFHAGSALAADGIAATAFVTTNTAAAMATLTWMAAEWHHGGKPTMLGAASGAVAGLVAITPGAGFVTPLSAIIIGGIAGIVCFYAVVMKNRFGYDDSLDVVGVHGVGGTWGALATGVFASKAVNAAGRDGLLAGDASTLGIQLVAIVATWVFAALVTFLLLKGAQRDDGAPCLDGGGADGAGPEPAQRSRAIICNLPGHRGIGTCGDGGRSATHPGAVERVAYAMLSTRGTQGGGPQTLLPQAPRRVVSLSAAA